MLASKVGTSNNRQGLVLTQKTQLWSSDAKNHLKGEEFPKNDKNRYDLNFPWYCVRVRAIQQLPALG